MVPKGRRLPYQSGLLNRVVVLRGLTEHTRTYSVVHSWRLMCGIKHTAELPVCIHHADILHQYIVHMHSDQDFTARCFYTMHACSTRILRGAAARQSMFTHVHMAYLRLAEYVYTCTHGIPAPGSPHNSLLLPSSLLRALQSTTAPGTGTTESKLILNRYDMTVQYGMKCFS